MPEYEFTHDGPLDIRLEMHRGAAEVTAEAGDAVRVNVTPYDDSATARQVAENFRVQLDGDQLSVRPSEETGWPWRRSAKVHVVVQVPVGSALNARTASADLRTRGELSVLRADLASGDAFVERVTGAAQVKAASGDITLDRVGGSLHIGSASGDLRVGDVTGDVIANTASGDLTVRSIGGSLQARTASGDIEVGCLARGQANVHSASGDVTIGVARGTGVWLDLNTASGSTSSDLAIGQADEGGQQVGLELCIRTASGDIHVHRAADDASRAADDTARAA
ncbi:putative adhesin [Krasilnikovia cinnamomea]|uniref:Putative adhesin n=1 Tax=Krasilnikovia cinnamomea TaxID=349313 RepID=A0A4Q7ZE82_9ACTN|nr:DUF4097 family beta strand repeat-containing protein [Krasilnikovia cinnamomea]RZU48541.1 putative adhesin [Krasilnikovia cinnamomea]